MNAYEQAVLFNNHGVALLASGSNEQREAISKFRCALAVIKAKIIDESKKGGEDKHSSSANNNDTSMTDVQSSSGREPPPAHPCCAHCCNNDHEHGENDFKQEQTRNSSILLDIQDFLEPIVIPFPELCNSGEDGDFFLYRHGFIISRSSSFSPSWEHFKKHEGTTGASPNPRPRKRSFPGASSVQADVPPPGTVSHECLSCTNTNDPPTSSKATPPHIMEEPQEKNGSYNPLSLDLLSSVVVFNMALAHNVEEASQRYRIAIGKDHGETRKNTNLPALNDVSRRLYDMSIGLVGTVLRAQEASKSVIEGMAVLAASSNNLAKILFDQGKIETARSTLKTLWYTTSWICEKVLLPQQGAKASASSAPGEQQGRVMTMSHVMRRPGTLVADSSMMMTAEPYNQIPSAGSNNAPVVNSSSRNIFDEMDGNFLARTPGWERTSTSSAFLFSETDIEGFIMNVMLMYHSQPPIVAKAA